MGKKKLSVQETKPEGIEVTCHRCGNKWIYRGNSKFYVPCSKCKTSINIRKFMPTPEPPA